MRKKISNTKTQQTKLYALVSYVRPLKCLNDARISLTIHNELIEKNTYIADDWYNPPPSSETYEL